MRTASRNKQPFWYALYGSTQDVYDEWGNIIAQGATYGKPVKCWGNISPAKGEAMARQFGDEANYDRVILVGDRDIPVDESSVIWIDREPQLDAEGNLAKDLYGNYRTPWNYRIKSIARSLPTFGSCLIAVEKINVS